MSFDKDFPNRKDQRAPYHGARSVSRACRHGGRCERCAQGRQFANKRREPQEQEPLHYPLKPTAMEE